MKIFERGTCRELIQQQKAAGKTVVFTNGCFDVLHVGHVRYLREAKALGDMLVIGLNSDQSVKELKGPSRPVNSEQDRAEVLAALEMVDAVVIFPERTAAALIRALQPDVYVKGGDYRAEDLPEAPAVRECGGRIAIVSLIPGKSSTAMINKLDLAGKNTPTTAQ